MTVNNDSMKPKTDMDKRKTPFLKGYKAWQDRKGVTQNPYPRPTQQDPDGKSPYWQWYAGWRKNDRENGN